jgi:DNA-directed RNA polymerase
MRNTLIATLEGRLAVEIAPQNPVKFLRAAIADGLMDVGTFVDITVNILYGFTRNSRGSTVTDAILMAEMVCAIGHSIRGRLRLKKDSGTAAKAGAFILYTFEQVGLLHVTLGPASNGHATYVVSLDDDAALTQLWSDLSIERTEKLPAAVPFADWTSTTHETGAVMIKTQDKGVLSEVTPEACPLVYESINRSQRVGWVVNAPVLALAMWAIRNRADAFADIWEMQDAGAKQSKLREVTAVVATAKRFLFTTFYHMYYYDFRCRKYPATAYFHEQGTDLSKGMLLRETQGALGESGFDWLLISIASNWAGDAGRDDGLKTDKILLHDRIQWANDNLEVLVSYVSNPKVNDGWMHADKPWQFISACMELVQILEWAAKGNAIADYQTGILVYIDGSNNGSQHLSALTRDEITAPHVNLVPLPLPGDLYRYVANHVWETVEAEVKAMPPLQVQAAQSLIDTLTDFKQQVNAAPSKSELRKELITKLKAFKADYPALLTEAAPVFWHEVKDAKQRRKVVKRNVMTLPYGGSAYGLGQQQIDDARKHGIPQLMTMEHRWGSYMGRLVFEDCKVSLRKPMQLLTAFEEAGRRAEQAGGFLSWHAPVTNFPVVQHYTEGTVHKRYIQYGPPQGPRDSSGYYANTLQLRICFVEEVQLSKRKQGQGAAPNGIHSLDAAHLTMVVCAPKFDVTTIHDSFGSLPGDMSELFTIVREEFVSLYLVNPLQELMREIGGDISNIEMGTLDVRDILDSEYAFV